MIKESEIEEVREIILQVESLFDRMKHLLNPAKSCPICGSRNETSEVCEACKNDSRC